MAKQQTDKSRYPSRYSPGSYVTAAQYIIELVCERKAAFDNTSLSIRFWNLPEWKVFFSKNLRQVHKLLRSYNEKAIIRALNDFGFSKCYSVFTERFSNLIQKHQIKLDKINSQKNIQQTPVVPNIIDNKVRPHRNEDNVLSKLKELDG